MGPEPSQMVRALGQIAYLVGLAEHERFVALGDTASIEDVVDLLDLVALALDPHRAPGRPLVSPERVATLAGVGRSDPQIAEALSTTVATVRGIRRRHGIAPAFPPGHGPRLSRWEDRLREAHGRGLTSLAIASELGWTIRTVQQRLSVLGLHANRAPRREVIR